jgi:GTP pyrophosphokinase
MKLLDTRQINNLDELINILETFKNNYNKDEIKKAFNFAQKVHEKHKRLSGDKFDTHFLTVASFVAQLHLDETSIIAAILHDTTDKGNIPIDKIDKHFGTDVAYIVSGLTDIRKISKKYSKENNSEDFKNFIFNSSEDLRIIIIRLCEKLHNIMTVEYLPKKKQLQASEKILNVYAPIAQYLGLGFLQRHLEDYAFKTKDPLSYIYIQDNVKKLYKSQEFSIDKFEKEILALLNSYNIKPQSFYGRKKGIYSIFRKVKSKYLQGKSLFNYKFTDLKDVFAFRVILNTIEECYIALGIIHSKYPYSREDFRDYISNPKENGYKSIHTVLEYGETLIEIQIRTKKMHEFNEYGPASHIAYKLQQQKGSDFSWTKDLIIWKKKKNLSKEDFKIKVFKESVFVFTPKGLVIKLPKGATPIDFAFRIHTNIGLCYQGALVNGKMVSKDYKLQTGDVVEIKTTKNFNVTNDWLNYCISPETKRRIRRALKNL